MKLSDTFVKNKKGNGTVQKYADGGGLFIRITPEGKKSWRLAYRFLGKQKLLVIGAYPTIGLKEAREFREEAKKLLLKDIDPSTARQKAKEAAKVANRNSFEAVAHEWVAKYSGNWTEGYRQGIQFRLETKVFPYIGKRPISEITAPELLEVMRRIETRGTLVVAHLVLRECGRIFRYAIATSRAERDVAADLRGAIAPMATTKHFAAVTTPKAIGRLLHTLDVGNSVSFLVRCALRLAPLVFVRAKELASAEWSHFDMEAAEWRIPAETMKMRQVHIVPLSRQAISILKELYALTGQERFLFPGNPRKSDKNVPICSISLVTAMRRMGFAKEEMTFHGFRGMASTILNEKGFNRDWIERQLAHCERNSVRASYNYAEHLAERHAMMQAYADYLDTLREKARKEQEG